MFTWEDHDEDQGLVSRFVNIPDPEIWGRARRARKGWAAEPGLIVRGDLPVEAARFTLADTGGVWHGWVVREIFGRNHSDVLPNREEALRVLLAWKRS